MRSIHTILLGLAALNCVQAENNDSPAATGPVALAPGEVIDLSDKTFNSTLDTASYVFIDFMSKSCGFCRRLEPELEEAAAALQQQGLEAEADAVLKGVQFVRVNANVEEALALRFDIKATPTFLLLSGGKAEVQQKFEIQAQPTSGGFVSEIRQRLGLKPVSRVKLLPAAWSTTEVFSWVFWRGGSSGRLATTLLYFAPSDAATLSGPEAERAGHLEAAMHELSQRLGKDKVTSQIRFALVPADRADLRKAFMLGEDAETSTSPRVLMYREHDDPKKIEMPLQMQPTREATIEAFARWIREQDAPLVDYLEDAAALPRHRARTGLDFVMLFLPEDAVDIAPARKTVMEELWAKVEGWEAEGLVARGQVTFLLVNGQQNAGWFPEFGLEKRVLPAVGVHERGGQQLWGEEAAEAPEAPEKMYGLAASTAREWGADETEAYRRHQEQARKQEEAAEHEAKVERGEATPTPMPTPVPFGHVPALPESSKVVLPFAEIEQLLRKRKGDASGAGGKEEL